VEDPLDQIKNFFEVQRVLYGPQRLLSVKLKEHPGEPETGPAGNLGKASKPASPAERMADSSRKKPAIGSDHPLVQFYHEIKTCTKCALGHTRTHFVFGSGNPEADLMFVGEAPGRDEDLQGKPFVGRAGQLLTLMLQAIDMERSDVFIANVLKCRPPNNRDPLPEEIEQCEPYLLKQIDLIRPKLIVALGRFASASLLRTKAALASLRQDVHDYNGVPLIVTYHPAALLRNPQMKAEAWEDLKKIRTHLG
jgi:DNA polymerase